MSYIVPAMLTKTITFKRLSTKNVLAYEVYGVFKDSAYASGLRTELLDTIENPYYPTPILTTIELPYNDNATWELPEDAFIDRDHSIRLFLKKSYDSSYYALGTLAYTYSKTLNLITLDKVMKEYNIDDKVKLEYYQDVIVKTYPLTDDCTIQIKPIFKETYTFGNHNVIM